MKKVALLFVVLMQLVAPSIAQWQHSGNPVQDKTHLSTADQIMSRHADNNIVSQYGKIIGLSDPKTLVWKWDTIVCYDTNGLVQRYTQTCDIHGNVLTRLGEKRQGGAWVNNWHTISTYDIHAKILSYLSLNWQSGVWDSAGKYTYSYDINGRLQTMIQQSWQSGAWVNTLKSTYTYNTGGNIATALIEQWQSGAWVNYLQDAYTYNTYGEVLTDLRDLWSGIWDHNSRVTYTYDGNGFMLTQLNETYQSGAWTNSWKFTYTYDGYGDQLTELDEMWQTSVWVNYAKYTNTFDINGNLLTNISQAWQGGVWTNSFKCTYTFDANGNSTGGTAEKWKNSSWQAGMDNLWVYSKRVGVYFLSNIYIYTTGFASFTAGIAGLTVDNSSVRVFPNPATDNLIVETLPTPRNTEDVISVCDISGRILFQQRVLQTKTEINISGIAKGIYLLKIESGDKMVVRKFIKE